jgi:uncharacterized protein (TIGR03083 family)
MKWRDARHGARSSAAASVIVMADTEVGAAPELVTAVAAWRQPLEALAALGQDCPPEAFDRPTECPGWSVRAQFAHVIGLERAVLGEPDEPLEVPDLPHVRNDLGRLVEVSVLHRRDATGPQLVAELEDVLARRTAQLLDGTHRPDERVMTPIGVEMPLLRALALRTFDCWTHEQDVRRALGRPGGLDTEAARVAVGWIRQSLPSVVARGARVPAGRSVALRVEGPVAFTAVVRVETAETGKPRGVLLPEEDAPTVDAGLRLTTEAYARRACGRISAADTTAQVSGDEAIAGAVLTALAVTP